MFDILNIVVLQFGKDGAMQMEKHGEAAFLGYLLLYQNCLKGIVSECTKTA